MTQRAYQDDPYARECTATVRDVMPSAVILDQTVFYPAGGGQPGDTGHLIRADGQSVAVVDTVKNGAEIHHLIDAASVLPAIDEPVRAVIDWDRRYRHMRLHTCLHLLSAIIDAPVTGGNIGADKARLDFDLPESIYDKQTVTDALNELIDKDIACSTEWITDEELAAAPALVKTMSVLPPRGAGRVRLVRIEDTDLQPCGGTHVLRTGEIGRVAIRKIEKKSKHNRRFIVTFATP